MCGFIAQLVEQRTGNAEVTGSNPVEALIFFQASSSNCLNWKIHCDDLSSPSSITAVQNESFHLFHIRMISIGYLMKKMLEEMGNEKHKQFDLNIGDQTLVNYEKWWQSYKSLTPL